MNLKRVENYMLSLKCKKLDLALLISLNKNLPWLFVELTNKTTNKNTAAVKALYLFIERFLFIKYWIQKELLSSPYAEKNLKDLKIWIEKVRALVFRFGSASLFFCSLNISLRHSTVKVFNFKKSYSVFHLFTFHFNHKINEMI